MIIIWEIQRGIWKVDHQVKDIKDIVKMERNREARRE